MSLVTADISVSSDGFSAGPNQREDAPFGDGVDESFHDWQTTYADDNRRERDGILDTGAFIMGRNMFSPFRGPWTDDWRGWWGDDPPYHAPVFVLTHHPRAPLEMQGGDVPLRHRRRRGCAGPRPRGRGRPERGGRGRRVHDQRVHRTRSAR